MIWYRPQIIVLSRVITDADSVELTARGVTTLVSILSSSNDSAVVHAGNTALPRVAFRPTSLSLSVRR